MIFLWMPAYALKLMLQEELVQLNTTSSYPVDRNFFYCTLMLFCLAKGCLAVLAMR